MKTIKILLGIIAINLTLITIIQIGLWPSKVQAREFNNSLNTNYGLVPLNENGNISIEGEMDVVVVGWKGHSTETLEWERYSLPHNPIPVSSK